MGGEEAVDETDLEGQEEAEAETEQTGANDEPAIEPSEAGTGVGKRKSQADGDEHHSGDGAEAENQEIENSPTRLVNGAEHEKRDGGGTRQAVNDTDK